METFQHTDLRSFQNNNVGPLGDYLYLMEQVSLVRQSAGQWTFLLFCKYPQAALEWTVECSAYTSISVIVFTFQESYQDLPSLDGL